MTQDKILWWDGVQFEMFQSHYQVHISLCGSGEDCATLFQPQNVFQVAPMTAKYMNNLFSIEMWGGATFDVALRFVFKLS